MDAKEIQARRYLNHFFLIMSSKNKISPRGMEIREIEDLQLVVDPNYPFMNFEARKYNVDYFRKEMLWKLRASKYDESIKQHAKMWERVQNPDGTFNSNYGQYWFGEQMGIWNVLTELIRDNDSRRAIIPMLNQTHMTPQTVDTVCTESVGFRIRTNEEGKKVLNMSVHMRSSDSVYGLGTDIPTFSFLYRLLLGLLNSCTFVEVGTIVITAMSSHIYATHYDMVNNILHGGVDSYEPTNMPYCTPKEAIEIVASRGKVELFSNNVLAKWLLP